ncbi:MAG: alpha/beta hydrolase [Jatrophihabitans sp.]
MAGRLLTNALYHPSEKILRTPAAAGLEFTDVDVRTDDGVDLHAWWIPHVGPNRGHVLLAHGNGGNIGDRVEHAALLTSVGFDVFLFDYRGYGRSTGRPDEKGTYLDARAARAALLDQPGVHLDRLYYLGESLGSGIVLELAVEHAPAGVVLMSAFASVRAVARDHYRALPTRLVPNIYPSLSRIPSVQAPVLLIHGTADDLIPVDHAHSLFAAAAQPKELHLIEGVGHNDLIPTAGEEWARVIAEWADRTRPEPATDD